MSKLLRTVYKNGKTLSKSSKTLEDLYKIICSHGDSVMAEYSTMTKKFTYSYKQAEADIGKIAVSISKETGETGKFIGLHGDNSYQWIVMFWGILKSGNKPYLINLRQPVDFTTRILKTLDVSHVVTLNDCPDYGINILYYDDLIKKSDSVSREINVAFGNEFALATSGTTLKEKICVYNGEKICNQLLNFPKYSVISSCVTPISLAIPWEMAASICWRSIPAKAASVCCCINSAGGTQLISV